VFDLGITKILEVLVIKYQALIPNRIAKITTAIFSLIDETVVSLLISDSFICI
jgi:hypothetical protein